MLTRTLNLFRKLKITAQPVPCWTEYLRRNGGL